MSTDLNPYVPAPEPAPAEAVPIREPVWSLWDVLMTAGLAFAAMVVMALVLSLVLGIRPPPDEFDPAIARLGLIAQALGYLVVAGYVYTLIAIHYRQPFLAAIRWKWPEQPWSWIMLGVLLSFAVMMASAYLPRPRDLPIERYFTDRGLALVMLVFGVAVAPLVEEVFFRGFLYPALRRRVGLVSGVVLTNVIFAGIHGAQMKWAWAPLLLLFGVGTAFTVARERTGSVSVPVLLHLGYNGTIFAVLLIVTRGFTQIPPIAP